MFQPGDKVLHQFNRDLGPGEVLAVQQGRMTVRFPRSGSVLQFAVEDNAFVPLVVPAGADPDRWHLEYSEDLAERLIRLEVDPVAAFLNRRDSLDLARLREAGGLGSYLGGRIQIFPHQLHVAELAFNADPVRWLLADEVGLGKTIEACLILSRLIRTGRAERVTIVTPSTLTVQWLGELYRKFHQIFVLLDADRRADVFHDQGEDFNPFEVHARSVISLEDLMSDNRAARLAVEARPDLLVVDEAHRLERRPGHAGNQAYRTIAPIAAASRNVLFLSATPMEADTHGFFRLLELLWPAHFSSWEEFETNLKNDVPLYPCTSSTRRVDIGGLPPRKPLPVDLEAWPERAADEAKALAMPAGNPLERKRRHEALEQADAMPRASGDPRIEWILERLPGWKKREEKILVFVSKREALDILRKEIEFRTNLRVAVFHEELSPGQRDIEVAQFAAPEGPTLLISTECGGEGRNFEFCRLLVLFDLPWDPVLVEQRIGRLDRINRRRPVEIVYFRARESFAGQVAAMYERLGIFAAPLGGLERSLSHVEEAIRTAALDPEPKLDLDQVVRETLEAREAMSRAVYHHLHRNRYSPELAPAILDRIPPDLEPLTQRVVVEACRQFGFDSIDRPEQKSWYFEFGNHAVIDHLPGATSGSRWLGTFDRETAVARESLDFFASGHPLVEGVMMELEDGHRGQLALVTSRGTGVDASGLLLLIKKGADHQSLIIDAEGRPHPEWARFLSRGWKGLADLKPGAFERPEGWDEWVRGCFGAAGGMGKVVGVVAFRLVEKS